MFKFLHILGLATFLGLNALGQVVVFPSQDLQDVVAANGPNVTFLLKAGVHRTRGVIPKDGQRFTGEAGAVLSGARQLSGFFQEGNVWVIYGQSQQAPGNDVGLCYTTARCTYPEDLFIDDVLFTHVANKFELAPGKWFFDYAADKIYIGENPGARRVETGVTAHAFASSARNVVIQGLIIEKFANSAQRGAVQPFPSWGGPYGPNWVIQDSEIRYNHGTGVRTGDGMQLLRNRIHHNGQLGIAGGGTGVLVDSNEIAFNNTAMYDYGNEAGGTKFTRTQNLTIRGNNVHDNYGPGLHVDIDNNNTLIENNRTRANKVAGIFIELSFYSTIRNNIIDNEGFSTHGTELWWGAGILLNSSGDVEISGNTVTGCANGIGGLQTNRGFSSAFNRPYWTQNVSAHDNTIVDARHTAAGIIRSGDVDDGVFSRNNRWWRNTYRVSNLNGAYFQWLGNGRAWSQWRAYGHDTDGTLGDLSGGTAPPPAGTVVYLSDLNPTYALNGWGPIEKDGSNGDLAAGDGRVLTIGGRTFTKGLGVHATSDVRYALGGTYRTFNATIGVDDEVAFGSVVFEVWGDGTLLYRSATLYGNSAAVDIAVDVTGRNELRLVVTNAGDNIHYDHADWADARITK